MFQIRELPEQIPLDATVHQVHWDWASQSIALVIEHWSFDKVTPGDKLPTAKLEEMKIQCVIVIGKRMGIPPDLTKEECIELLETIGEQYNNYLGADSDNGDA